jgi:hypothetical protein
VFDSGCDFVSCGCDGDVVTVDGGSYQSEVSWNISDCDGTILFEGGAPYSACLDLPENFVINMFDSYGDGWNGNIMNINGDGTNNGTGILTIAMGSESTHIVGSCESEPECEDVVLTCGGGSYQTEVGWTITDADGNVVAEGGAPFDGSVCLSVDGCYDVNMVDSWGDGWNGNTLNVGGAEFTIDDGASGTGSFCMPINAGCMDETACDYDPDATIPTDCDYTSCGCDGAVVSVGGGSYQTEVGWTITDCDGNVVASGGAPYEECVGVLPDNYIVNMTDSWGDGWNGNTWTATSNTGGASFGPFTLVSGSSGSENFCLPNDCYNIVCDFGGFQAEVGWLLIEDATGNTLASGGAPFSGQCSVGGIICTVYGCMDSTAINYNSNANVDDGSCAFCISTLPYFEDFESGLANEIILIDSTGSTSTIDSVKNNNWSWHGQGNTGVGWGSSYNTGSASFNSSPSHIAKGILCV